jgi:hypothetical protein
MNELSLLGFSLWQRMLEHNQTTKPAPFSVCKEAKVGKQQSISFCSQDRISGALLPFCYTTLWCSTSTYK